MCWADRMTLIGAVLWGLFCASIAASAGQPIGVAFTLIWAVIFLLPIFVFWVVLRLILGDRGALHRY